MIIPSAPTLEDMGVPQWVIDENLCPGLPSWEALKSDECVANFATPDSLQPTILHRQNILITVHNN